MKIIQISCLSINRTSIWKSLIPDTFKVYATKHIIQILNKFIFKSIYNKFHLIFYRLTIIIIRAYNLHLLIYFLIFIENKDLILNWTIFFYLYCITVKYLLISHKLSPNMLTFLTRIIIFSPHYLLNLKIFTKSYNWEFLLIHNAIPSLLHD